MARLPAALLLAVLLTAPALWQAFATGEMPVDTALTRYLLAVVAARLGFAFLDSVTGRYVGPSGTPAPATPSRRRDDPKEPQPSSAL